MPNPNPPKSDAADPDTADLTARQPSPRPDAPPSAWTGEAGVEDGPGRERHDLGPSSEAIVAGRQSTPPPPTGYPNVATADAERVGFDVDWPEPEPGPEPATDRLAVGSHVVALDPAGPGDLPAGPRYGIILEAVALPGALEPTYRVGWLATDGQLVPESALTTTADHAERQRQADGG